MQAIETDHSNLLPIGKSERAAIVLNEHIIASMTTGLIPLPLIDFAALTGIQLKMIHSISKLYEKEFSESRSKALIASLVGGGIPITVTRLASLAKFVPGIGSVAGTIGMVTMGGASTYALGRVLTDHFESGHELNQLTAKAVKKTFSKELKAGRKVVIKLQKTSQKSIQHSHEHSHASSGDCGHDHSHHDHSHHHDHEHPHTSGGDCCDHDHDHDHSHGACGDDACGHDHAHDDVTLEKYKHKIYLSGATLLGLGAQRVFFPVLVVSHMPVFLIAGTATLMTGSSYIKGLWSSITNRKVNTNTLVGSATVASLVMGNGLTALAVLFLLNVGEYFEAITLRKTNKAIKDLLEIDENEEVWLVTLTAEGQVEETLQYLSAIEPDNKLAVYAGQRFPVDGVVVDGEARVNQAPVTGEEMPVNRKAGDQVFAGSIIISGKVIVKVKKIGQETVVGRIIERVHEAEELRPPIQTVGEEFSRRFVPFSFAMSGAVLILTLDPTRALTMLLIACPCAVGLSTPTSVSASIGNSAKRGILIRGGSFLETAAQADVMVFDKTGTLTTGLPSVTRVISYHPDFDETKLVTMAATAELHSNHPLGDAILAHARQNNIEIISPASYQSIPSCGMRAAWEDGSVYIGNKSLMEHFGIQVLDEAHQQHEKYSQSGETVLYIAYQNRCIGLIGIHNTIRPHVFDTLKQLRDRGISKTIMLTGDQAASAKMVARAAGIDEWHAELMPEDKYHIVRKLQARGLKVIMVGDGINDAPALAIADVGIALGTGSSDVAIESADIALSSEDFRKLDETLQISNKTIATIRQNYGMALVINAGGLVAAAMGMINPFAAVILHNVSTAAVLINSSGLVAYNPDEIKKITEETDTRKRFMFLARSTNKVDTPTVDTIDEQADEEVATRKLRAVN